MRLLVFVHVCACVYIHIYVCEYVFACVQLFMKRRNFHLQRTAVFAVHTTHTNTHTHKNTHKTEDIICISAGNSEPEAAEEHVRFRISHA